MGTRFVNLSAWVIILACFAFLNLGFARNAYCKNDSDPHMTGLPELTQEELEWQNKHMIRVKKVKLNKIGLERINNWRKQKGEDLLTEDEVVVVKKGKEVEGTVGEPIAEESEGNTAVTLPQIDLPPYIDNSSLKFFPPIRSQGSLPSCGVFSGTYYAMTYMHALARDLDVKNGGNSYIFSPKWTYNMVNRGGLYGTWYYWAYVIGQKNGCATWEEFPYVGSTSNPIYYREWSLDKTVWRNAIDRRFDRYGYVGDTHTNSGIEQVKQLLVNGYILNIPTYINSWQWKSISNDPDSTEDDSFVGNNCVYWVNGTEGYHAMTVVGNNDDIWVDINNNGFVDSGEKGAFRIANSWGTGWGESGFCWMAYDALKNPSAVTGAPSVNRIYGWSPSRAHWVTARTSYQPKILAEFTLNHLERYQLRISLGVSDISQVSPDTLWYPEMIYFQGGPYAFNGLTTAVSGTFVFDFSDIAPSGNGEFRYYLGMYDNALGDLVEISSYQLIDVLNGNIITECFDVPKVGDAEQIYAYVDYSYGDGNIQPEAVVTADQLSGQAPLSVNFDGSASNDIDGMIVSYEWDFGDGGSADGATPHHTYTSAGVYHPTLTVTDDGGAKDSYGIEIVVTESSPKKMYVYDIAMSLFYKGKNAEAQAEVTIIDEDGDPVANATIIGEWSGLTSGIVSGQTGADGVAKFTAKSNNSGIFIFKVSDVSGPEFTYDSTLNEEIEDSISTDDSSSQNPVADAGSDQTITLGDFVVLDGSESYDPDGTILSYVWSFENGETIDGVTATYMYDSVGTHMVTLTVTDDNGAIGSDSTVITVTDGYIKTMYVSDIALSISYKGANAVAQAEVSIIDADGDPVANATVTGRWSGLVSSTVSGTTDSNGSVSLTSLKTKKSGTFTFTVIDVSVGGYTYDESANFITSDFITSLCVVCHPF